jgi:CBS domain-containing protein
MKARDIMTRPVITTTPTAVIGDAAAILVEHGFAALPVVDEDSRVIGILSETDALNADSKNATVESIMTVPVEVLAPNTDVATIADRMVSGHLRSMPVVEAGFLIGIVAHRDVLRLLSSDDATIAAKVRGLLDEYAGSRRAWSVEVHEGRVEIGGGFADPAEQRLVASLAHVIEGVRHVEVIPGAISTGV